jgi:hypothetical protein
LTTGADHARRFRAQGYGQFVSQEPDHLRQNGQDNRRQHRQRAAVAEAEHLVAAPGWLALDGVGIGEKRGRDGRKQRRLLRREPRYDPP